MPEVKSVFFGPSPDTRYDSGVKPCCAINANNAVVTIHEGTSSSSLNWRVGRVNGVKLSFVEASTPHNFDTGYDPTVALTDDNIVIELHGSTKGSRGYLFYHVGTLGNSAITFPTQAIKIDDGNGYDPSVAVVQSKPVVEVHNTSSGLYYRLGQLKAEENRIEWSKASEVKKAGGRPTVGNTPSVSMNKAGELLVAYENSGTLHFVRGKLRSDGQEVVWNEPRAYQLDKVTPGKTPSVALTEDGYVFEIHEKSSELYQRIGRLANDGYSIDWQAPLDRDTLDNEFDDGQRAQIATNGKVAIQVHETESSVKFGLFANAALVFDHANWMGDHREQILQQTLRDLALPASHDSGAYTKDTLGQDRARTQSLTIYGQLASGTRYFDIRPIDTKPDGPFDSDNLYTHHAGYLGPRLATVLTDIRDFMQEHHELVILKISHYSEFKQATFNGMVALIVQVLEPWLFTGDDTGVRLANRPMEAFLRPGKGTVLVVADSDGDHNPDNNPADRDYLSAPRDGIYRYRDWYATDPEAGDLTVFDIYGDTSSFTTMAEGTGDDPDDKRAVLRNGTRLRRGQWPKFVGFDGICRNQYSDQGTKKDWPCDLFLLSWTLTPAFAGGALALSREANQKLVDYVGEPGKNPKGLSINLIYTDAVQNSRSADVALVLNGLVRPA
jgi:hypothetical protein